VRRLRNPIVTAATVALACLASAPAASAQKFQRKTQVTAPLNTQAPGTRAIVHQQPVLTGCMAWNLMGKWQGGVAVALPNIYVDMVLVLAPDGSYSYYAGQGAFPWTLHTGAYTIASNGPDPNYECLVTLYPNPETIANNPENGYGLLPLQMRNLMADRPQAFRVSTTIAPGRLIFFSTFLNRNDSAGMFSLERGY